MKSYRIALGKLEFQVKGVHNCFTKVHATGKMKAVREYIWIPGCDPNKHYPVFSWNLERK